MSEARDTVFSEYEVKETSIKFSGETSSTKVGCVGSLEEELESLVITKKCEGVITKKKARGTGTGTIKLSLHIKYDIFERVYGMIFDTTLKAGVKAYGQNSIHEAFCLTAKAKDEDGNVKYKAYPNCVIESGISRKIENGAEEVAEVELEVSVMPDEYGFGMYEALEEDLTDETLKTAWMTNFTSEGLQKIV